nr:Rrf2 family transcriptional regulator [Streptomyces sp. BA2]
MPDTAATEPVPAARLAQLHDASPSYLAKQMQALSRADLVKSIQGKTGGYVLTRARSVEQDSGPQALPAIGTWLNAANGSGG